MKDAHALDLHEKRRARVRRVKRIDAKPRLLIMAVVFKIHRLFRGKPLAALRAPNLRRHDVARDRGRIVEDMRVEVIEMRVRHKEIHALRPRQETLNRLRGVEIIVKDEQSARKPHGKATVQ